MRCIFTDTQLNNITVVKSTVGGDSAFAFTGSLGAFNLTTANGTAQRAFTNLQPGAYRISETVSGGWSLTGTGCANSSNPAGFTLQPGANLTCTFANTKQGSLIVVADATGGNNTFSFASQALGDFIVVISGGVRQNVFANLAPGAYDLFEQPIVNWNQGLATCSNGSNPPT